MSNNNVIIANNGGASYTACSADIKHLTDMLKKNVSLCEQLAHLIVESMDRTNVKVANLDRQVQMLNSAVADLREAVAACTPDPQ